jgi:hypothetical protein
MAGHEVRWMFHSTAMVPDYDVAIGSLARLFGLRVLHYGEQWNPELGWRGGMTWIGDNSLELSQPILDGTSTDKFVRRSGGGVHSFAVQVADLAATKEHLASVGIAIAASPGEGYFFTDPRQTSGIVVQWSVLEMPEDPRFNEQPPSPGSEPAIEVVQHAFVGAVVADPIAVAEQMSRLMATAITFVGPGATPGDAIAGVSLGDCSLLLYALDGVDTVATWGREYPKSRTHVLGLLVADLESARTSLAQTGVAIVRQDERQIIVDPSETGGVAIALVGELPTGDPRLAGPVSIPSSPAVPD